MSLRKGASLSEEEAALLNPLQLAYIGDSVWEMLVRYETVFQKVSVHRMHQFSVDKVNAHAQAERLAAWMPYLKDTEREIARRGRNAHAHHPAPRNQNPEDYAHATGLEALLGFLYLTGNDKRILELYEYGKEISERG